MASMSTPLLKGSPQPQLVTTPPQYQVSFQGQPPQLYVQDPLFVAKMENIVNYEFTQSNPVLRAATSNIWPNHYILSDRDIIVPVLGHPDNIAVPNPVFAVEEESSWCCRLCCRGNQPFLARLYHISRVEAGPTRCGCCYAGHQYILDRQRGPIMTFERDGCCSKWLGCFVCSPFCQNDMYMHTGNFAGEVGTTKPEGQYLGRSVQPDNGGGTIPTLVLHNRARPAGVAQNFGYVEGPCIFAGWKGVCCGDKFTVSSQPGGAGDLGEIFKRPPEGCCDSFLRIFASGASNVYNFKFSDTYKSLSPEDKAITLGGMLHMNYMLFQNDVPPVMCRSSDDGKAVCIYCTLWECYCSGCVLPCQICIVLANSN